MHFGASQLHLLLQEHVEVNPWQFGEVVPVVRQRCAWGTNARECYFPVCNYHRCVVKFGRPWYRSVVGPCELFDMEAGPYEVLIDPFPCSSKLGCQAMHICLCLCSCPSFKNFMFCKILGACFHIFPAMFGRVAFNPMERNQMDGRSAEECIDVKGAFNSISVSEATTKS